MSHRLATTLLAVNLLGGCASSSVTLSDCGPVSFCTQLENFPFFVIEGDIEIAEDAAETTKTLEVTPSHPQSITVSTLPGILRPRETRVGALVTGEQPATIAFEGSSSGCDTGWISTRRGSPIKDATFIAEQLKDGSFLIRPGMIYVPEDGRLTNPGKMMLPTTSAELDAVLTRFNKNGSCQP